MTSAVEMFGCEQSDLKGWFVRNLSFVYGENNPARARNNIVGSILSDAQELIERDQKERARQLLNRAKWALWLSNDELNAFWVESRKDRF